VYHLRRCRSKPSSSQAYGFDLVARGAVLALKAVVDGTRGLSPRFCVTGPLDSFTEILYGVPIDALSYYVYIEYNVLLWSRLARNVATRSSQINQGRKSVILQLTQNTLQSPMSSHEVQDMTCSHPPMSEAHTPQECMNLSNIQTMIATVTM
jgi:hypothetical protein